ncbi:MAG TPA: flagellar basal body P-ring protein FlgI [Tepidisphaeraceae bacterium]|jgi:flagellar P-ring protein precursor FlgI|nr:flagellar basal body P-ring protein FlgI [Tepidisphaeraceae bacterium]
MTRLLIPFLIPLLLIVLAPIPARAVKVADITRIGGERTNILTGLGLVYGLKGTGDGGSFTPAIAPLRSMLAKFGDPVTMQQLGNAANVAVVMVTATVPAAGARDGDHLDVHVSSVGAAASLHGGRLFVTPMQGPLPGGPLLALADGPVTIEDPSTPTVGVIRAAAGGAVMETDLPARIIDASGRFSLILDEYSASWGTASRIAKIINDSESVNGETLATAVDAKNIIVTIPINERDHPDSFIARIQQLPVQMLSTKARVTIDQKTGTIIMTGDVEISPVVISHNGLSISTIMPPPQPSPRNPMVTDHQAIAISTTGQGNGNLQDLVAAMEQLKVPALDRIQIIEELYKTGKLHAELIEE